jgi:hypothetical protein
MALEVDTSPVRTPDTVLDWKLHLNDSSDRPFALVSKNLLALRSLTVDQFLHGADDDNNVFDITDDILEIIPRRSSPTPPPEPPTVPLPAPQKPVEQSNTPHRMQIVARLHQTFQRVFGNTDGLKFEFLEEDGANSTSYTILFILLRLHQEQVSSVSLQLPDPMVCLDPILLNLSLRGKTTPRPMLRRLPSIWVLLISFSQAM